MITQLQEAGHREKACMKFLKLILKRENEEEILENVDKLINAFREEGISDSHSDQASATTYIYLTAQCNGQQSK